MGGLVTNLRAGADYCALKGNYGLAGNAVNCQVGEATPVPMRPAYMPKGNYVPLRNARGIDPLHTAIPRGLVLSFDALEPGYWPGLCFPLVSE